MSAGFELVETRAALDKAVAELEATPLDEEGLRPIYLDTEFDSTRRGIQPCLLQLSAGREIYLVDPLVASDLEPMADLLAAEDTEWVLHAGSQDVRLLVEHLRIPAPRHVFDTQIAFGLLGAEASVSLPYLQYRLLGVRGTKAHQGDDWLRRPLPSSQLSYAAEDVRHLPALRARLAGQARALGRLSLVRQATLEALTPTEEAPPPPSLTNLRSAWLLDAPSQAALVWLLDWVSALEPRARASAPEPKVLLALASRRPESAVLLARQKGVGAEFAARFGATVVEGLERAARASDGEGFVPLEPAPYATFEQLRLEAWLTQLRASVCEALSVAPELVLPGRMQQRLLAAVTSDGPGDLAAALTGFRRELLGPAIRAFVAACPPPSGPAALPGLPPPPSPAN
jgi:ribonuclease D